MIMSHYCLCRMWEARMVARHFGHSLLLVSYLHRIGRQQSPVCPYWGGDDETAQHLLLCCPSHVSARTSTNYINSTDPRRIWSFLESIGAVTRPPTGNEREREAFVWVKVLVALYELYYLQTEQQTEEGGGARMGALLSVHLWHAEKCMTTHWMKANDNELLLFPMDETDK